jgi:hypothetical protein
MPMAFCPRYPLIAKRIPADAVPAFVFGDVSFGRLQRPMRRVVGQVKEKGFGYFTLFVKK